MIICKHKHKTIKVLTIELHLTEIDIIESINKLILVNIMMSHKNNN